MWIEEECLTEFVFPLILVLCTCSAWVVISGSILVAGSGPCSEDLELSKTTKKAMMAGLAAHHAGHMPAQRAACLPARQMGACPVNKEWWRDLFRCKKRLARPKQKVLSKADVWVAEALVETLFERGLGAETRNGLDTWWKDAKDGSWKNLSFEKRKEKQLFYQWAFCT